jgi:predicted TPR repeat methyltransferase
MIGHLGYAAPQILFELANMVMPGETNLSILDLGCGTGLAGAVFRPLAARLDGVDLSPAMIEKARARNIYEHLAVQDLTSTLGAEGPSYDLILAADTLVYLGDLKAVFEAAHARLAPDGYFLFTVEKAEGEGFELGPKRRWRHSENYLRQLAQETGFVISGFVAAAPRREANVPVEGFAVALTR